MSNSKYGDLIKKARKPDKQGTKKPENQITSQPEATEESTETRSELMCKGACVVTTALVCRSQTQRGYNDQRYY